MRPTCFRIISALLTDVCADSQCPEWAFGYDKNIRNGVHSLSGNASGSTAVFFPASNTGVMHFYHANGNDGAVKQELLRGHTSRIAAVAVSDDKEWIATGDVGEVRFTVSSKRRTGFRRLLMHSRCINLNFH